MPERKMMPLNKAGGANWILERVVGLKTFTKFMKSEERNKKPNTRRSQFDIAVKGGKDIYQCNHCMHLFDGHKVGA